jgi:hypothetical protein
MEKLMDEQPSQTHLDLDLEEKKKVLFIGGRKEGKEKIVSVLKDNLSTPFTADRIAREIGASVPYTSAILKELKKAREIKVVGWDMQKGTSGATALKYQMSESPLPKFKTTVDNNLYLTVRQFYKKKLRGKRVLSLPKAENIVENLPVIPLIINQRAYAGYAVSDLKEAFKDYIEVSPVSFKRRTSKKVKSLPVEVEAAMLVSREVPEATATISVEETSGKVSNPISKKKSLFSTISSLFKKEKVTP